MTLASTHDLLVYLADLVEELERFAVTLLPPADGDELVLGREPDSSLVVDLEARLPVPRRSSTVDIALFERWRPTGPAGSSGSQGSAGPAGSTRAARSGRPGAPDEWACVEYRYELRHHELGYRRAFHRHDEAHFVRMFGVATHEHCEATLGVAACDHYHGPPVADAFEGFRRLYALWLTDAKPDCASLACIE